MSDLSVVPAASVLDASIARSRRFKNRLASVWMWSSFLIILVPLAALVYYVVANGAAQISADFLTSDLPTRTRSASGGIGPAIIGTILITAAATAMAVPLGVLGAIYLHEYGGNGALAKVIRFFSDVMTGVPSIVMGLFVY